MVKRFDTITMLEGMDNCVQSLFDVGDMVLSVTCQVFLDSIQGGGILESYRYESNRF